MTIKKHITKLRELFREHNISGYIVPSGDEYLSEYPAAYAKRLEYITGFTGSNGLVVISCSKAYFFTDGRYFEQAHKELDSEIFEIGDLRNLPDIQTDNFFTGQTGYDPKLFTWQNLKQFSNLHIRPIETNLIDQIWQNKPLKPASQIYIYPIKYAGISRIDKIKICQDYLKKHEAEYLIVTKADSICWLLNLRGSDIDYCPMFLSYAVISENAVCIFTNITRISSEICEKLGYNGIKFYAEEKLFEHLSSIKDNEKVLIDEAATNSFIISLIKNRKNVPDPCILPKACKNKTEIDGAIQGHIYDAVAMCEFLSYVSSASLENLTEYDLALTLTEIRSRQPLYISDSFATICGFRENGSIIHYNPAKAVPKKIAGSGLLLIDSGAHYMGATTDITRTIAIGTPTKEQKNFYTKVLKGHIALAMAIFPEGTTGSNLDILARQFLWQEYADYAHGTGHGVGSALNVHEGPQNINLRNGFPLQQGMILSNEPGYYKQWEYGIRIENLMYVENTDNAKYLQFKQLTLVPYAKVLINFELLNNEEIEYIKSYYTDINKKISPLLSLETRKWLEREIII